MTARVSARPVPARPSLGGTTPAISDPLARIAVIAFEDVSPFHLSVPCLVFEPRDRPGLPDFELRVCAAEPGPLRSRAGFDIGTRHGLKSLDWADTVIVPSWRDADEAPPPALLKAFLEQVMRPGVAFDYGKQGKGAFARTLLDGRSARVVVTMGMPAFFYRFWYLGHGVAGLRRNILNFVGMAPVRETLFGMVESVGDARRGKWIAAMYALGKRAL